VEKWEKLKGFNQKQIADMQGQQMQAFFAQIKQGHPYYRDVLRDKELGSENAGFSDLPFTTGKDLAQLHDKAGRIKKFQLAPPAGGEEVKEPKKKSFFGKLLKGSSGDETADPKGYRMAQVLYAGDFSLTSIPLVYTSYDIERLKESGRRLFDLWGLTRDDTMVNAFSYAPHLGFWQVFYAGLEKGSTLLQSGGGRILGTEKILTALENMKAEVLFAAPLYAKHLLQAAIKFNTNLSNLTTVVLGMEPASQEIMARIKDLMLMAGAADSRVMRSYFVTEAKSGWGECAGGEGFHIHPDLHYVEVIDPDSGEVVGENQPGEIVLTHLDSRGTCLFRYKTGIRTTGGISYGACRQCGTSLPRLAGDLEELKNNVAVSFQDQEDRKLNLEEITRRLDQEKTLLLWQGALQGGDGKPVITITSSWFNKDDSPVQALAAELTKKYAVETVFITDSYSNIFARLELETGFRAKRWVLVD
jgi:phenylacetate-CoA ligase